MSTGSSLNYRLLCAAGCAYDIPPDTCAYKADPVFSPAVSYTNPPKPICAGTDLINACLVGQNSDGIIVAFRGTLPFSLKDPASLFNWLQNFFAKPISAPDVPGMIHEGFYDGTSSIIAGVAAAVQNLNPGPTTPIYVTGHSLGGAMASIGAYILSQTYHLKIQQVVTFASPKPGDTGFRTGYQAVINNQVRYENYEDIVPLLPPADSFTKLVVALLDLIPDIGKELADLFKEAEGWNYVPVGSGLFIEADQHTIISNEPIESQVWDVFTEFGEDLWEEDFSSFAAAHMIAPSGGYYRALSASSAAAATV